MYVRHSTSLNLIEDLNIYGFDCINTRKQEVEHETLDIRNTR